MSNPDVGTFRRAIAEEFELKLGVEPDRKGRMYGLSPWAELYNFLADLQRAERLDE